MKKQILTAALALFSAAAFAQGPKDHKDHKMKSPAERARHHSEMMAKDLNLSADQRAKIEQIDLRGAENMKADMARDGADRAQMRAMHERREAEYKQVLSDQQFQAYQQMKKERHEKMKERMKDRRAEAPARKD